MRRSAEKRSVVVISILLLVAACGLGAAWYLSQPIAEQSESPSLISDPAPKNIKFETSVVTRGLSNPWDLGFLPDGSMLVTERGGKITRFASSKKHLVLTIEDVQSRGEGGLTGLAIDNNFSENNYIYTCYNSLSGDVRLVRWKFEDDTLGDKKQIVTGMPSNPSGRHSGCRVKSATDGTLWVGTGDAADAKYPQDKYSLGGKILHVTREGKAASDSAQTTDQDPRVFNYGHRNIQGLILFDQPLNGVYGYSIEHGSDIEDEINLIKVGNFGWDPKPPYDEGNVPMTDTRKFQDAIKAVWNSDDETIAPSGGALLIGKKWGKYSGAVAMAVLKNKELRIVKFDQKNNYAITLEESVLKQDFGRLRSATLGPDGNLYLTTDNDFDDKIIKVIPSEQ